MSRLCTVYKMFKFLIKSLMLKNVNYRPTGTHNWQKYNDAASVIIPFKDQCHGAIPYAIK